MWRRWGFGKRRERIEITHETNTVVIMRKLPPSQPVVCPECGSGLDSHDGAGGETLICRALLLTQAGDEKIENAADPQTRPDERGNAQ